MSDLHFPWICAVPLCRTTHTVEDALGYLHQKHRSQLVLTTDQDHAFATLHLKDLLGGLASRTLRLDQNLAAVSLHHPLCLLLLADSLPGEAWWSVWKRLANPDHPSPNWEYGFIDLAGKFLGLLDYGEFLNRLVEYCPDQSLTGFAKRSNIPEQESQPKSEPEASRFNADLNARITRVCFSQFPGLLQENHRLALENQYKTILIDRLGHDLKTPVTSIMGLATLLKEHAVADTPLTASISGEAMVQRLNRQGYYGQVIYQSSRYLMSLVNRLMELAHLETEQKILQPGYLSLPALLHRCWNQAQEELALRAPPQNPPPQNSPPQGFPPHRPQIRQPCPAIEPELQIWGDRESNELLLTLFLAQGLETIGEGALSLQVSAWGAFPATRPWLILTLERGEGTIETFLDPSSLESLDLWIARRFAQWQGGDLNAFGSHLDLILPQSPLALEANADRLDPTVVLVGLGSPQDWLAVDPLTALKVQLKDAGLLMLFATDIDELLNKLQRFQPALLLLDEAWTTAWEILSLYHALQSIPGLDQIEILGISLQAKADQPTEWNRLSCQGHFQLPQDGPLLGAYLWEQQKGSAPTLPLADLPATVLWLGQSGEEEQFSSLFPGCQILAAEDVEQAELLAQIWDIEAIVIQSSETQNEDLTRSSIRQSSLLSPLRLIALNETGNKGSNFPHESPFGLSTEKGY